MSVSTGVAVIGPTMESDHERVVVRSVAGGRARDLGCWVVIGLVVLSASGLRIAASWFEEPQVSPDSAVFLGMAAEPAFSRAMWFGGRAPVVPLVYKALGGDAKRITRFQAIAGSAAWGLLTLAVAARLRTRVGRVAAAAALASFSVLPSLAHWDSAILAESLSFSLIAVSVAFMVCLLERPRAVLFFALLCVLLLWCFVRDADTFIVAALGGFILAAALVDRFWRRWMPVAATCLVAAFAAHGLASASNRWVFPFLNVIAQRILTDETRTAYFAFRGMPVSDRLVGLAGQWASSDDWAFYSATELETFRQWVHADGRRVYALFLITHPGYSLFAPLPEARVLLRPDVSGYFPAGAVNSYLTRVSGWRGRLRGLWEPPLALAVVIVLTASWGLRGRSRFGALALFLMWSAIACSWLVWHADAMEVARHALPPSLLGHLGLCLAGVELVDRAAFALAARRRLSASTHS